MPKAPWGLGGGVRLQGAEEGVGAMVRKLSLVILAPAAGVFLTGTPECVIGGLLCETAVHLGVRVPHAGLLIA
ncbi:hypothetical protein [Streptomyces sp. NPDC097610]|uniref:hypothetical protein n=1 Tax=Streptomyces sp. NPDC097610 TaxID=3157227 RepID=UPI0033309A1B